MCMGVIFSSALQGTFVAPAISPFNGWTGNRKAPKQPGTASHHAQTYISCHGIKEDCWVVIADFGEASLLEEPPKRLYTPVLPLPPEFLLNEPLGTAIDLWTLGGTLYNLLGERDLLEDFMRDEDHAITEMISTLGPLHKRWWDC
ncbi:hypothetical protein EMCG_04889 [[Emmonsia] crescens]|uniref:Protein kinase domain-containing protein n=1 Tax=[Emmonsia] crescens TaxID=73230 RepID=A0A0G2IY91_9EURO|nr:hypothetical protein EMCG_04889 [Emmonsia crescens UAMH 3008]